MKTTATDINSKRRSELFMPIDETLVDSFSWLTTLLGLDNEEGVIDPMLLKSVIKGYSIRNSDTLSWNLSYQDGSIARNAVTAYPKPLICFQRVAGQGRQGGRVVSPSCNFRYEIDHFYSDPAANAPTPMQPSPKPQRPTSQEGLVIVSPPPPATNTTP
ncbi:hypothetical protein EZV62_026438 [Acer yangbiense]|uniref:Uncharacterized protein n=1 Tax=Acer yangbiense TaxID=1000413 RepID=A0A5C7GQS2_9ROSI|nr:hypothetical protein EZV62_026438 [Acer yangbiense]